MMAPSVDPRRRVLVVEDDFYLASSLASDLAAGDIEVVGPVPSVAAALDLIARTQHIDGAVLDINLNGEAVYPVADLLRQRHVPYVFTTGYDARSVARHDPDAPCFEKPVVAAELVEALFDR